MAPPLIIVVLVSMIKDAYEDINRHIEDSKENNEKTRKYNRDTGKFEQCCWRDIQVGDLVKIQENEFFPADILLLSSSETEGICYVETKNLDGETNLKTKYALQATNDLYYNGSNLHDLNGVMNVEWPNNRIYKFDGNFILEVKEEVGGIKRQSESEIFEQTHLQQVPLNINNVLLRGMSLKNTEDILGCVVYTGHDTKI